MIVGCPSSLVRRLSSTMASKDISSLITGWILTKLGRNDPNMTLLKIVQMVPVHCISRSHRLKQDFQGKNFKNLLLYNHKA